MGRTVLYLVIATFLFSTMEIVLKLTAWEFNPIQITFSRFLAGGLALLPFALHSIKKKRLKLTSKDWGSFALLGFICVGASMILYQISLRYINGSVVAVLFSCNPVFATILAAVFLKEQLNPPIIIALICQVLGVIAIINPLSLAMNIQGVTAILISTVAFSVYSVLNKRPCQRLGGLIVTSFSFIAGGIEILLLSLLTHIPALAGFMAGQGWDFFVEIPLIASYSPDNLLQIIYIYICVTGIGYLTYLKALEISSVSTVSLVFFFKPILGPIFAFFILKEMIPLNMLIGICIILAGALFSIYGHKKAEAANSELKKRGTISR